MPLDSPCFDPSVIEEPELEALYRYWSAKACSGRLPARADLDPTEVRNLLPHLILVDTAELISDFRFRLHGTEVCSGFGQDRTNLAFGEIPNIANNEEVHSGYWRTYKSAVPVYFHGRTVSSSRNWLLYSRLTLPLSTDGRHVNMILGGFVFFSKLPSVRWPGRVMTEGKAPPGRSG